MLAKLGGRTIVMHAGKIGWTYIYDAATGVLLRRSQAFVPQENLFAAPNKDGVLVAPGPAGGANWPPSSWSPRTGLLYVSATDFPMIFTRSPQEYHPGQLYIGGGMEPPKELVPRGTLSAIDPATGRIAWQVKHDTWLWGGTLATAGDLVFMGDPLGYLHAYDARTGRELWSFFAAPASTRPPSRTRSMDASTSPWQLAGAATVTSRGTRSSCSRWGAHPMAAMVRRPLQRVSAALHRPQRRPKPRQARTRSSRRSPAHAWVSS